MRFSVASLHATTSEYTIPLHSDGMVSFVASQGIEVTGFFDGLVQVRIADDFGYGGLLAVSDTESALIPIYRHQVSPVLMMNGNILVLNTHYLKDFRLFHRNEEGKRSVEIKRHIDVSGWTGSLWFVGKNQEFTHALVQAPIPAAPTLEYYPTLTYRNNRVELHLRVENISNSTIIQLRGDFTKDIELHGEDAVCYAVNSTVFGVEKWFEFTVNDTHFRIYLCKPDKLPTHLLPTAQAGRYRFNQPSPVALVATLGSTSIQLPANSIYVDTDGTATDIAIHTAYGNQRVFTQTLDGEKMLPTLRLLFTPLRGELDAISKVPVTFQLRGYPTVYIIEPGNRSVELAGIKLSPGLRCLEIAGIENAQVLQKAFYILS